MRITMKSYISPKEGDKLIKEKTMESVHILCENSKEKTGSNIVVEWMSEIRGLAREGYKIPNVNAMIKNEKFQRIMGICDAVIMVLKEDKNT